MKPCRSHSLHEATILAVLITLASCAVRADDVEQIDIPSVFDSLSDEVQVPSRPTPLPPVSFEYDHHQAVLQRVEQSLQQSSDMRGQRLEELRAQLDALRLLITQDSKTAEPSTAMPPAESPTSSQPTAPPTPAPTTPAKTIPTTPLSNSPIDRFALANNLFASGQFRVALETFRQINPETMSAADRRWAKYQTACCYRKLESNTDAEQLYRELASESSDDFVGTQSRWWLDRMQKRQRLESSMKGLDDTLHALEAQIYDNSGT